MLKRHRIGPALFTAIGRGGGGQAAGQQLAAAERSKTMLALRYVVEMAGDLGHPGGLASRNGYVALSDIHRADPGAVETVIRHPAVGAWALDTAHRLGQGDLTGATPARLAVIAAAAAIRAGYPYTTTAPIDQGAVVIPSLGRIVLAGYPEGEGVVIKVAADGANAIVRGTRVPLSASSISPARRWQGIRQVTVVADGILLRLVVDDIDPYRFAGLPGAGTRLTEDDLRDWQAKLSEAWQILVAQHRPVADELRTMIVALTPIPAPGDLTSRSATAQDAFGCIALSPPTDGLALAVTLAHEIQHAKLTAATDLADFTLRDSSALFYAPWRDDPRPAFALLHGCYAYLGVAAFCRRQRHLAAGTDALHLHSEYLRWRDAVSASTGLLLAGAGLTALGRRFVHQMQEKLRSWQGDQVPAAAVRLAQAAAVSHRSRWDQAHGHQACGSKSESIR